MAFTDNQLRAITESGNIIVSAGAGSGKTTVMIARIIDKLKKGASLDEMLIVTFTRASAADMRVKLTDNLYKLKADPQYRAIADNALELLPACNIGTLHSYCQRLVRMYFFAADLDPSAAICEECEADSIKQRVVSDAVEAAWNNADPYFMAMYDMLCIGRSDDGVKEVVGNILEFALTMPDPKAYLADGRTDEAYFDALDGIVAARREAIAGKINALKLDLAAAGMAKHVMGADDMLAYIDGITDEITTTKHTKQLDYTDDLNEQYKDLKKLCSKFRKFVEETQKAKAFKSAPYSFALRAVAADALQRYAERKKMLGKIDYSDLEHGAYNVLRDSECLGGIAQNIKYVFIDEFQDVNPLQSAIAECFRAAGAEMFVVGDVKQSIYGFRRCSPEHFKRAIASPNYTHIPLTDNFRSSEAVIDFVNSVFDKVMTEGFGGVNYKDAAQRLVWGNKTITNGKAVFYAVDDDGDNQPAPNDTLASPSEDSNSEKREGYSVVTDAVAAVDNDSQAELVADCIVDYIKHSPAPKTGNIAVLVRSVKSRFCAALCVELDRRGIKYCLEKRSSAKSFPEVVALMDILRCADNRLDDVALYTAMRSAMGGFSDEELARIAVEGEAACRAAFVKPIAVARKSYAFWQKVNAYRGEYKARVDKFIAERDRVVQYAINHDCADVLGFITSKTDYFQHVYEQGGSAAAVDALIRFAADRACDMHAFLAYYDGGDIELSASGGGDAVAITTMHSSKGLEYDLVIVADVNKQFSNTDKEKRVLISENGVFVKVAEEHLLQKTVPWLVENLTYSDRQRAEELRLFYVALTRAKRNLIVCGKKSAFCQIAPEDSKCMMHFLSGQTPDAIDVERLPIGDDDESRPYDENIAAAVSLRHKQAEEYNARRIENALPVKTCVTAVAHDEWDNDDYTAHTKVLTVDDRDGSGESVDAMLRGTAYHRAMELADFDNFDIDGLRQSCENFSLVNEREIENAVAAMKELAAGSAFVAKERYFIVNLPASEVYGDGKAGNVLVQGVIDLLIVDKDGNATIVDYKTGNPATLINDAYRKQLQLYKAAVERTTPYKVKRAVLYSFAAGKLIEP
ncbi:MAG: UvrD-helicase domain-containing protein [Clostridiales bacterium]|nr:UvrD-helicase domain-containing protein [Clostridiales bacterium]